jgi:alpha-galactosidase
MNLPTPRSAALSRFAGRALALAASLAFAQPPAPLAAPAPTAAPEIRTPKAAATPRLNGPGLIGVRPGHPLLYRIPASGDKPMEYSADDLPAGVTLDARTGILSGSLPTAGEYAITLRARNLRGTAENKFKIVVGETIALTPPMGWNSWNAYHATVTGDHVIRAARAMVSSGLIDHGWSYINIDDAWQAPRGGSYQGIQPNEKFPDFPKMCAEIHALGLKVGLYSTPWVTSYAGYVGGSADNPEGTWTKPADRNADRRLGQQSFAAHDAQQWAAWGIDYLKYDWNPRQTLPAESPGQFRQDAATMANALRASGRDIVFSYSNSMPFEHIADQAPMFNCWRTTGDIGDSWASMAAKAFYMNFPRGQTEPDGPPSDRWAPFAGPGHWNDPDMMVLGIVNFGNKQHPTRLTPDEQYLHMTQWCMAAAPLLLGCDLEKLDNFTLNLVTNDEVLAVDQDPLGRQATLASNDGNTLLVYARPLADGTKAVAFYNLGRTPATVVAKWSDLKLTGTHTIRDLWRQKDLGASDGQISLPVAPHGAELISIK